MRILKTLSGILMMILAPIMPAKAAPEQGQNQGSAYDYSFHTLIGNKPLPLADFKGKVVMVVNTASNCGFTPQYEGLEKLYEKYKDRGFVIVGVPSNDFGGQEPGSSEEISSFCRVSYGVTFPMAAKEVVSGDKAHPFYLWARKELGFGSGPKWNFHKYIIDRNGKMVDYFYSTTKPNSSKIISTIEKLL